MTKKNEKEEEVVLDKDPIKRGIQLVEAMPDEAKTNIKGKLYAQVARRNEYFWKAVGIEGRIENEIIELTDEKVVVGTKIYIGDKCVGNDFAEEYRGQGMVNKTSALENCITSSIGRALSCIGLSGGEYASSFEVDNAVNNKAEAPQEDVLLIEVFATFVEQCKTEKALMDWWKTNSKAINERKSTNRLTYDAIVSIFAKRKEEIKEENSASNNKPEGDSGNE
tara:strand:+ start:3729 stop:4397 length:669 start_codon:yes stop_codon:yes gene_type:complete